MPEENHEHDNNIPLASDPATMVAVVRMLSARVHDMKNEVIANRNMTQLELKQSENQARQRRRMDLVIVCGFIALLFLGSVVEWWDARQRRHEVCEAVYQNRDIIRDLVDQEIVEYELPPNTPQALIDVIEQSQERSKEFRENALNRLDKVSCDS